MQLAHASESIGMAGAFAWWWITLLHQFLGRHPFTTPPRTEQEVNPVKFPAGALALGLAGAAAAVSMTLFTPTLRFVRCYWLEMNTPEWARDYVGGGPLVKAALQLHLLLPMAATLLWVSARVGGCGCG